MLTQVKEDRIVINLHIMIHLIVSLIDMGNNVGGQQICWKHLRQVKAGSISVNTEKSIRWNFRSVSFLVRKHMIAVVDCYLYGVRDIGNFCHKRQRREVLHTVAFSIKGKIFMCAFQCYHLRIQWSGNCITTPCGADALEM